jgi:hypothetical protein|tara:strand:+ start:1515 stop:1745 length:231 start_codon:yes stop_codon:yes gene_type:complete
LKINTKHLERNWSAWHSAASQCKTLVVRHGDCVLSGPCEMVRDGHTFTLTFPVAEKAQPLAALVDPIKRVAAKVME